MEEASIQYSFPSGDRARGDVAEARCDSDAPSVLESTCSFSAVATACCSSSPGTVPSDAAAPGVLSSGGTDHRCARSLPYAHLFDEPSQTTLPSSWHKPLRSLRGLLLKCTSIRPSVAISPVPRKPSSFPSLIATISRTCTRWSFPCLYHPGRGRREGELGRGTSGGALDGQTAPMASSYVCRHAGQPNGSLSQNDDLCLVSKSFPPSAIVHARINALARHRAALTFLRFQCTAIP